MIAAIIPWIAAWISTPPEKHVFFIGGGFDGYLSPCGCTKPMSGGIVRMADVIRSSGPAKNRSFLVIGPLTHETGRQTEMKAETLAESLKEMGVSAIGLSYADTRLGQGMLDTVQRLSGNKLIYTQSSGWNPSTKVHGIPVFAGSSQNSRMTSEKLDLPDMEKGILLWDGDLESAKSISRERPELKAVIYRSEGKPSDSPLMEGGVQLITPGDRGKYLVRFEWDGSKMDGYQVITLGPDKGEDEVVGKIYDRYLQRLTDEHLLDQLPRVETEKYAGSSACLSCHEKAAKVWSHSFHHVALETLEAARHDKDPDCVGCHTVGLRSTSGFVSREKTPDMAWVGCENCHGPGQSHVMDPKKNLLPSVGENKCITCHDSSSSPGFEFSSYWKKIAH